MAPLPLALTIAGGLFQVVGFSLVIASTAATLRKEHGEVVGSRRVGRWLARPFVAVWRWLIYWLTAPSAVPLELHASASSSGTLSMSVRAASEETDIEQLQRELRELRERVDRHEEDVTTRLTELDDAWARSAPPSMSD